MVLFVVPVIQESTIVLPSISSKNVAGTDNEIDKEKLEKEIAKLQTKLDKLTPNEPFLIVNTSDNHFYLYKDKVLIREGLCSTGKNEKLVSNDNKKEYIFHTPQGVRKILRKQPNPVWAKPDWAFIEEGLPIPPKGHPSRFESGTLGAYKLEIGDGFLIHGTIYKRFMGLNVTHGCVRLGDDDLEVVYKTLGVGSKVYIY